MDCTSTLRKVYMCRYTSNLRLHLHSLEHCNKKPICAILFWVCMQDKTYRVWHTNKLWWVIVPLVCHGILTTRGNALDSLVSNIAMHEHIMNAKAWLRETMTCHCYQEQKSDTHAQEQHVY